MAVKDATGLLLLEDVIGERLTRGERYIKIAVNKGALLKAASLRPTASRETFSVSKAGEPRTNTKYKGTTVRIPGGRESSKIAPLSEVEYRLLKGVAGDSARYEFYTSGRLKLNSGDDVFVELASVSEPVAAVLRWRGVVHRGCGIGSTVPGLHWFGDKELKFGIEIVDVRYVRCGDSNGRLNGVDYFHCESNCGSFVSWDKLFLPSNFDDTSDMQSTGQNREVQKPNMEQVEKQIKELEAVLQQQQKESTAQIGKLQQDLQSEKDSSIQFQQLSVELQQQLSKAQVENSSLLASQQESIAFGMEPWKVSRNKVELGSMIGGGGWGVVYEGKLQVAVKHFYPNIMSEQNISRFKREMRMLALIRHPNLLQFIAAVFDENEDHVQKPPYIITELLDTSLRSAYENALFPSHNLLSIFIDTARALDYLHRRHEPIIHRDVSSANVLLKQQENGKWIAKLSDLGSANLAKEAYTMNESTPVYCAPEAFTSHTITRSEGTLTPKVDVYSYGIMLCEVATSTFPDGAQFPSMLARVRREWPQLHQLIVACTNQSPEQRPTMASVLASLETFPSR